MTTTRKPVTIDLEAMDVSRSDNTVGANDIVGSTAAQPDDDDQVSAETAEASATTAMDFDEKGSADPDADPSVPEAEPVAELEAATEQADERTDAPPSDSVLPPPVTSAAARRGGLGAIGAGVIGGLITLAGAGGLQWAGVLPSPGNGSAAITEQVASIPADLEALRQQVAALEQAASSAPVGDTTAITDRLAQSETALSSVQTELANLQQSVANGGAGEGVGLDVINGDLARLRAEVEALAAAPLSAAGAEPATAEQLSVLEGSVAALGAQVAALSEKTTSDMAAMTLRLDAVEAGLSDASATLREGSADASVVARALAAAGLKSAIDRGTPFMAELEAYASVAGEDETVVALRNHAAAGVPTVTALADDFAPVANRIVATGQGVGKDAGIGERLMASARSLVQVRPVGEVPGDRPGAIAARIEARLKAGDLAEAQAEWEKLPEAAKAASAPFMEALGARQTVDGLVAGALSAAMQAAQPAR